MNRDHAAALQPGQQSKTVSKKKNYLIENPGLSFFRSKSSFDGASLASDKNDCKTESKNDPKTERKKSSSSSQVI